MAISEICLVLIKQRSLVYIYLYRWSKERERDPDTGDYIIEGEGLFDVSKKCVFKAYKTAKKLATKAVVT